MEIFNNLNVPPVVIDWEALQTMHCDAATKCSIGSCRGCLFRINNLEQFKIWYKSNLKNEEREGAQPRVVG